jgi:electron transfer flavoprotein alpha subunit
VAKDILVLAEQRDGKIDGITFELLSKGRAVADKLGVKLGALLLGCNVGPAAQSLDGYGVDTLFVADHPILRDFNGEAYRKVIFDSVKKFNPGLLLVGYTYLGVEVGPAVATKMGVPMFSNCVDLEMNDGRATVVRPVFGGLVQAKIAARPADAYVVSFQKGALPKMEFSPRAMTLQSLPVDVDEAKLGVKVTGLVQTPCTGVDITKADIIVSAGRGIGSKENIQILKELADSLGGVLGCSRPVADYGWLADEYHVGVSGKTVAPKVYIACGISGAIQHVSGMRESRTIIAINKDSGAPIFQVARYGVVGNLFEIVPALIQEAKNSKAK